MQLDKERFEKEKVFLNEYWKFRKEYGTPESSDEYWHKIIAEWERIAELCGNDDYCLCLMWACFCDIESRYRIMFGTPSFDENLAFFNASASEINKRMLRKIGLKANFERVV